MSRRPVLGVQQTAKFYLTGWLPRICTSIVPNHSPITVGADYSPPVERWQA